MKWNIGTPPNEVKKYLTKNNLGHEIVLEWFEGDYFESEGVGFWADEKGEEVKNITHWKECQQQ